MSHSPPAAGRFARTLLVVTLSSTGACTQLQPESQAPHWVGLYYVWEAADPSTNPLDGFRMRVQPLDADRAAGAQSVILLRHGDEVPNPGRYSISTPEQAGDSGFFAELHGCCSGGEVRRYRSVRGELEIETTAHGFLAGTFHFSAVGRGRHEARSRPGADAPPPWTSDTLVVRGRFSAERRGVTSGSITALSSGRRLGQDSATFNDRCAAELTRASGDTLAWYWDLEPRARWGASTFGRSYSIERGVGRLTDSSGHYVLFRRGSVLVGLPQWNASDAVAHALARKVGGSVTRLRRTPSFAPSIEIEVAPGLELAAAAALLYDCRVRFVNLNISGPVTPFARGIERRPRVDVIEQTYYSGFEADARIVVRSAAAWDAAWRKIAGAHSARRAAPEVDFAREIVIVAATGWKPSSGYSIGIDSVWIVDRELRASVTSASPGTRCGTADTMTSPAVAVRVPRSELPIRFIERDSMLSCR